MLKSQNIASGALPLLDAWVKLDIKEIRTVEQFIIDKNFFF